MRNHFLLALLIGWPWLAFPQTAEVDSLRRLITRMPNDSTNAARCLDLAEVLYRTNLDSANHYADRAMDLGQKINDPALIAKAHQVKGVCHYYAGQYEAAMKAYLTALQMRRSLGDEKGVAHTLSNIAILQIGTGMAKEAIQTNQELFTIYQKQRDTVEMARALVHISSGWFELQDFDKSLQYLVQALHLFEAIRHPFGQSLACSNLGSIYLEQGDLRQARQYLQRALGLKLAVADLEGAAIVCHALGEVAGKEKNYPEAVRNFQQAIEYARSAKSNIHLPVLLKSLAEASLLAGDPTAAYQRLSQYIAINDSLSKATYSRDMADMQTKHETAKKEAAIRELENQQRIQKIMIFSALAGILALLVVLWLARRSFRQKQRLAVQEQQLQREKIERLESERKVVALNAHLEGQQLERLRIAEDLHDDFGSGLSKISLLSEVVKRKTPDPPAELDKIAAAAKELLLKMGEVVWALNHRNDTLPSLAAYIRRYTTGFFEDSDLRCHFDMPDPLPELPLSGEERRNVFLVVKESLHNILKHAAASQVEISFILNNEGLEIEIRDDGRGFDPAATAKAGNGLQNMGRRMQAIGSRFRVESNPGKGTTTRLYLPLDLVEAESAIRRAA